MPPRHIQDFSVTGRVNIPLQLFHFVSFNFVWNATKVSIPNKIEGHEMKEVQCDILPADGILAVSWFFP